MACIKRLLIRFKALQCLFICRPTILRSLFFLNMSAEFQIYIYIYIYKEIYFRNVVLSLRLLKHLKYNLRSQLSNVR